MAFTKNEKSKMMEQYGEWLDKSQAMFMLTYDKMNMPTIDAIRNKVREAGGEAHVAKNTLLTKTLADKEYPAGDELTGTTLVNFAFTDAAAVAKAVSEIVKDYGMKIKYGYLDKGLLNKEEVAKLGTLPSLPEMRAKLLGTIMAPASQLVRTINEPGRGLAAVIQANVDKQNAPAE
ncbi:MAG: 50S ribosomal protein L10 [Anaerolineaceae bacterium]|nr:50S ribosomal protein L10 [Anaerolineaceae bacterium]